MQVKIENPKVLAAIIDCLNLPISKKVEAMYVYDTEVFFIYDEWNHPGTYVRVTDVWPNIEILWHGAYINIMHAMDIGNWEIDLRTGESRWICCYNEKGKIEYGRYYEPQYD